jgi:hypothetical protein
VVEELVWRWAGAVGGRGFFDAIVGLFWRASLLAAIFTAQCMGRGVIDEVVMYELDKLRPLPKFGTSLAGFVSTSLLLLLFHHHPNTQIWTKWMSVRRTRALKTLVKRYQSLRWKNCTITWILFGQHT